MDDASRLGWDARHREGSPGRVEPFLVANRDLLPGSGRAVDMAGGTGASVCWLAGLGLDVTVADWSEVALERAGGAARAAGVRLRTVRGDLEGGPFPAGPWDLIVCLRFLHRPLFETFPAALAAGGVLVVVHPTASNLARHPRPGRRYLLEDGELPKLVGGLTILRSEEGWGEDGRHVARIIARL